MKKGKTLALIGSGAMALVLVIAAIIPIFAGYIFLAIGAFLAFLAAGFGAIATWFLKTSDEPHEKAIWGAILLVIIVGTMLYFGLPLLKYWYWILFVFLIFVFTVLYARRKIK